MSKGSNTQQTQSSSAVAPNPAAMAAYSSLLSRAGNVSNQPFQPYTGPEVAPINERQLFGADQAQLAYAGFAPYAGNAGAMINNAGQAVTAGDINTYMDPYTQSVIDATQRDFDVQNQRAQSATTGNAAAQGALGGNRVGVAQALTQEGQERVQAPVMASLRSKGFQSAEEMANQQKSRELQAGQVMSAEDLRQAQGQFAFGTAEQQTTQAAYTQAMTDYYTAQGYPFATAQWLAGITLPTGAQMGSTTQGTQTTQGPQPNQWLQGAGLGIAGLGALGQAGGSAGIAAFAPLLLSDRRLKENIKEVGKLHDGQKIYKFNFKGDPTTHVGLLADEVEKMHPEAVGETSGFGTVDYDAATEDAVKKWSGGSISGFAAGGTPYGPGTMGWVPTVGNLGGTPLQAAPLPKPPNMLNPQGDYSKGLGKGLSDAIKAARGTGPSTAGVSPQYDWDANPTGGYGGVGEDVTSGYARGGSIRKGFASGGVPISTGFAGGISGDDDDVDTGPPVRMASPEAVNEWRKRTDNTLRLTAPEDPIAASNASMSGLAPDESEMPVAAAAKSVIRPETTTVSARGVPRNQQPFVPGAGVAPDEEKTKTGPFGLSPEANQALISLGLGMMSSRVGGRGSFLAGVGDAGAQAMGTYASAKQATAAQAAQARKEAFEREKFQELQRQHDLPYSGALTTAEKIKLGLESARLAEQKRQHNLALKQPVKIGTDDDGMPIMALPRPTPEGEVEYYLIDRKGNVATSPLGKSIGEGAQRNEQQKQQSGVQDASFKEIGTVGINNKLLEAGTYNYSKPLPITVDKGMELPEPEPVSNKSAKNIKADAEYYLETGKLPPQARGFNPGAIAMNKYRDAVQNYAAAISDSRGLTPEDMSAMRRQSPETYRFIRSAAGNTVISLGTAVRHLDTLRDLQQAWNSGDVQMLNRVKAIIARQFGDASVTSLEAAANIVGAEVVKAIVGAQSGQSERDEARKLFSPLLSGAQAYGNIDTVQKLLGGQLEGKERQARNLGVTEKQFKDLIGERPYDILKNADKAGKEPMQAPVKASEVPAGSIPGKRKSGEKVWKTPDGRFLPRE